jgi:hypothetical protein
VREEEPLDPFMPNQNPRISKSSGSMKRCGHV